MKQIKLAATIMAISLAVIGTSCSTTSKEKNKDQSMELIRSSYTPGELSTLCKNAIEKTNDKLNTVAAVSSDKRTYDNTMLAFESVTADFTDVVTHFIFMAYVHPDAKIRQEASTCEEEVGKFSVTIFTRKDLYLAIKDAAPRNDNEKRLLSETLKRFEKNGLKLQDAQLAQVKEKMQRLAVLESQFSSNLNNDTSTVEYTAAELSGLPESFLSRQAKTKDGKKFIVTTKTPDYKAVMENATSPETRERMLFAYFNRAGDKNIAILDEALKLRKETATLLGYKTWADYRTDGRMAKSATIVSDFLGGLKTKLAKRNQKDLTALLKFKKTFNPKAKDLQMWDLPYLSYQLKKKKYDLDDELIKQYFPTEKVVQGIFDIYSKILGVRFNEVKDVKRWAPELKLYEIIDADTQKAIGYFYADLYPRAGKYGHFAAFSLTMGRMLQNGYSQPVSALVGNFSPPSNGKPSLIGHDDVETMFHEFGHIMHQTLTRAPYASLSGSEVARDFVEAPSQMLEEWAWSPSILANLSQHYEDANKKLPAKIVKKMTEARDFNQGYFYTRQLFLASLDMKYHTSQATLDVAKTHDEMYKQFIGVDAIKGGKMPAGFGHLMGYDAGYYSYLWSEVYALDMATSFEKAGFLDTKTGMNYRQNILEQGNMQDGDALITKFLKRKPNNKAFFKKLGV